VLARLRWWIALAALAAVFTGCLSSPPRAAKPKSVVTATPSAQFSAGMALAPPSDPSLGVPVERLVGQLVMTGMTGTRPDADLLRRVRAGEIGGVILFTSNTGAGLAHALASLQQAASAGGNPPLLISVDQEGGTVKRLPGPPESPRSITSPEEAFGQGDATGLLLAANHINVDLAPIADVSRDGLGFEAAEGRGFSGEPAQVAALADGFARGLQGRRVAATAKHFPGIGSLTHNTDAQLGHVELPGEQLQQELIPFRRLIEGGVDIVMTANAVFPTLDPGMPAVFSPAILQDLLRGQMGFQGVVITDGLDSPPDLAGDLGSRGIMAVKAGADVVLFASPAAGPGVRRALLGAAQDGRLPERRLRDAYAHVVALKGRVVK
jgi:beta-N-acetylhexosaminidase